MFIGEILRIEVREEVARFYPDELSRWKSPIWWQNEHWKKVVPESEWPRIDKYRDQSAKRQKLTADGRTKGTGLQGYHFGEVKQMRELQESGFKWLYENYWLFDRPSDDAEAFRPGYDLLVRTFGEEKMAELHQVSRRYYVPTRDGSLAVPDLFAYREEDGRAVECHFRDVKQNDQVSDRQLLGMALIESVLDTPVKVFRYLPEGKAENHTEHRREFWPLTA
jgi:hypothetical protein